MNLPFRLLVFFCVGAVLSFALPAAPPLWFGVEIAAAGALLWYGFRDMRWAGYFALAAALVAGGSYALWRTDLALSHRLNAADSGQIHTLTIQVTGLPETSEFATRFKAKVLDTDSKLDTIMLADYRKREWPLGSTWQVATRLNASVGTVNIAGFNREAWALSSGVDAFGSVHKSRTALSENSSGSLLAQARAAALARIKRVGAAHPQGAALVAALTLGVRSDLDDTHWQAFRRLGMTHLVSISGLHVGMAALFAAFLAATALRLWMRFPTLPMPRHPKTIYALTGLVAALLYALIAGFSVPTQRSVVMIAVAALALSSRRFFTAWQIWWLALAAVLVFDPLAVLSVGFWLSFGLVAALIFFTGNIVRRHAVGKLRLFGEAQYAATLASIVPLGLFFAALPMVSPLANAVGIPWFSIVLTPLALLALLCPWDGLLQLTIWFATHTLNIMNAAAPLAPMYPVTQAPFIWVLLALLATTVWLLPRGFGLRLWAVVVLIGFVFFPASKPAANNLRVTAYDVGQGLSLLLQTQQHTLLFDTGKAGANLSLIPSLYADGIHHLDTLILSHHDNDHDGALEEIRTALPIKQIFAGRPSAYSFPAQHCGDGLAWQWDGVFFEFLTPNPPNAQLKKDNDESCVLHVIAGKHAFLVTGDLSEAGEMALMRRYGDALYSQVLVLGHHGSRSSSSARFLDMVEPQYALISSGFGNSFSHPHPVVMARLAARNIKIRRSDTQGALRFDFRQDLTTYDVIEFRPYWQQKPFD